MRNLSSEIRILAILLFGLRLCHDNIIGSHALRNFGLNGEIPFVKHYPVQPSNLVEDLTSSRVLVQIRGGSDGTVKSRSDKVPSKKKRKKKKKKQNHVSTPPGKRSIQNRQPKAANQSIVRKNKKSKGSKKKKKRKLKAKSNPGQNHKLEQKTLVAKSSIDKGKKIKKKRKKSTMKPGSKPGVDQLASVKGRKAKKKKIRKKKTAKKRDVVQQSEIIVMDQNKSVISEKKQIPQEKAIDINRMPKQGKKRRKRKKKSSQSVRKVSNIKVARKSTAILHSDVHNYDIDDVSLASNVALSLNGHNNNERESTKLSRDIVLSRTKHVDNAGVDTAQKQTKKKKRVKRKKKQPTKNDSIVLPSVDKALTKKKRKKKKKKVKSHVSGKKKQVVQDETSTSDKILMKEKEIIAAKEKVDEIHPLRQEASPIELVGTSPIDDTDIKEPDVLTLSENDTDNLVLESAAQIVLSEVEAQMNVTIEKEQPEELGSTSSNVVNVGLEDNFQLESSNEGAGGISLESQGKIDQENEKSKGVEERIEEISQDNAVDTDDGDDNDVDSVDVGGDLLLESNIENEIHVDILNEGEACDSMDDNVEHNLDQMNQKQETDQTIKAVTGTEEQDQDDIYDATVIDKRSSLYQNSCSESSHEEEIIEDIASDIASNIKDDEIINKHEDVNILCKEEDQIETIDEQEIVEDETIINEGNDNINEIIGMEENATKNPQELDEGVTIDEKENGGVPFKENHQDDTEDDEKGVEMDTDEKMDEEETQNVQEYIQELDEDDTVEKEEHHTVPPQKIEYEENVDAQDAISLSEMDEDETMAEEESANAVPPEVCEYQSNGEDGSNGEDVFNGEDETIPGDRSIDEDETIHEDESIDEDETIHEDESIGEDETINEQENNKLIPQETDDEATDGEGNADVCLVVEVNEDENADEQFMVNASPQDTIEVDVEESEQALLQDDHSEEKGMDDKLESSTSKQISFYDKIDKGDQSSEEKVAEVVNLDDNQEGIDQGNIGQEGIELDDNQSLEEQSDDIHIDVDDEVVDEDEEEDDNGDGKNTNNSNGLELNSKSDEANLEDNQGQNLIAHKAQSHDVKNSDGLNTADTYIFENHDNDVKEDDHIVGLDDANNLSTREPKISFGLQRGTQGHSNTQVEKNIVGERDITTSVVTWNLAESSPSEEDASFLAKFRDLNGDGSDLVLIGGQETESTKPRRSEGSRSRELRRLAIKMLGKNYVPLALHSLGGVQLLLFCKRSILHEIEFVSLADVACGVGNVFHNKGGIGVFLKIKARTKGDLANKFVKMLFIVSHMAAHVKHVDARNADYWRILSELETQAPPQFLSDDKKGNGGNELMKCLDHAIFCGDLNYRIDLPREITERTLREIDQIMIDPNIDETVRSNQAGKLRLSLLRHDQLLLSMAEGNAFNDFVEGEISFPPTFKFDKGSNDYDTSHKQRIPAWTDRILFKPNNVKVLEYNSIKDSLHSDHRPVYASLILSLVGKENTPVTKTRKRRVKRKTMKQQIPVEPSRRQEKIEDQLNSGSAQKKKLMKRRRKKKSQYRN